MSGTSTITQQLVRAVLLDEDERTERTFRRKVREIILAAEISRTYEKNEILELYLNEIYFGNLAYGIEAAAQTYFDKSADELTLAEATLLSYTSPVFIPCIAWLWLGEAVSIKNWIAVLLGFGGIVLILRPGSGIFNVTALVGICAGLSVGLAAVTIRRMSDTETPGTMVFYFTLISTLVSASSGVSLRRGILLSAEKPQ